MSGITVSVSIWNTSTSYSAYSSACTAAKNSRAPVSDWLLSSASSCAEAETQLLLAQDLIIF